ncbi:eukaryotic translation initiation factor 3 subunit j, partial [Phtheirospermum japonicum]
LILSLSQNSSLFFKKQKKDHYFLAKKQYSKIEVYPAVPLTSGKKFTPKSSIIYGYHFQYIYDSKWVLLNSYRLVEEADYKSTAELFAKKGDDKTLENFIPKTESDFAEYAELISHKLLPYEKSYHYIGLLKAVMRLSLTSLKGSDAKEIASSITAIANEKIKAEKEANAGKKKTGKKNKLHVGKQDDDVMVETYDDFDDYDFM